jgi:DNA-binding NtrC family response regulator
MNSANETLAHESTAGPSTTHSRGDERTASPFEIVVVSSDPALRCHVADILVALGIDPVRLSTLRECEGILAEGHVGLVFCSPRLADGNYQDFLAAHAASVNRPRIVVTSRTADWDEYKEAMQCGAFDIIPVPCRRMDVEWVVIQAKRAERQAESRSAARVERSAPARAASA